MVMIMVIIQLSSTSRNVNVVVYERVESDGSSARLLF